MSSNSGAPTLVEVAYERLKSDLVEFRMRPGDRYSESELAARLSVSRTPLRVALFMLVREGYLVKTSGHSAWMVRSLDVKQFEDLYDVRVALEALAIQKVCRTEPLPDLSRLRRIWLVSVKERVLDGRELARLDEAFHAAIVAATGNAEMVRIHADLTERIRIVRRLDFLAESRLATTYEEHAKLLRAIMTRRENDAIMLLRAHIESSKAEIRHISLHKLALAAEQAGAVTNERGRRNAI